MNIDLKGQTALVTGATGQLGRTIATTLGACGADVAVHFRSHRDKAEELREKIEGLGVRVTIFGGDITKREDVFAMRDAIADQLAAPSIVVLNAVEQYPWKSVLEQSEADYESQFRSSILQAVHLAQAFVPAMQERKAGRFIAINTECAMQCSPSQGAYVSGKRGMDGVLRVLAREIGPDGITVNQVAPGWMISDAARESGSEKQEGYEANVPLRRRGDDRDIANAVAFLASDLASFITGVYLPVCGGHVMPTI